MTPDVNPYTTPLLDAATQACLAAKASTESAEAAGDAIANLEQSHPGFHWRARQAAVEAKQKHTEAFHAVNAARELHIFRIPGADEAITEAVAKAVAANAHCAEIAQAAAGYLRQALLEHEDRRTPERIQPDAEANAPN